MNTPDSERPLVKEALKSRKRLWALSLILLILAIGLIYAYFNPPLRRDSIPKNAYIIPWVVPNPSVWTLAAIPIQNQPWNLSQAMAGALTLNVVFRINLPNGTRIIPSTIYLSHDNFYLYVGGIFRGTYSNPSGSDTAVAPSYFDLLLDPDNDGLLTRPETGSLFGSSVGCPYNPNTCGVGADGWGAGDYVTVYTDMAWAGGPYWQLIDTLQDNSPKCIQPSSLGGMASEYNTNTGTIVMMFARRLNTSPVSCGNTLQMRQGELWVMGFILEFAFTNQGHFFQSWIDGWPRAYPWGSTDASWWPKLAIDLAAPPIK